MNFEFKNEATKAYLQVNKRILKCRCIAKMVCSRVKFIHWLFISPGEPVGVGSVAGGGRYDNLVGMFDPRKKKVR